MTNTDFIIKLFCGVDNTIEKVKKDLQATLYPNEWVTIVEKAFALIRSGFSNVLLVVQSQLLPLISASASRESLAQLIENLCQ